MKISEYIAELQKLQDEHGDLDVYGEIRNSRVEIDDPEIAFARINTDKKSWEVERDKFFKDDPTTYPDSDDKKGEKVVKIFEW